MEYIKVYDFEIDEEDNALENILSKEEDVEEEPKVDINQRIEEKRRKSRIRSKAWRDRRNQYIKQLESKIKDLEAENFRLQSLLMNYRGENMDNEHGASNSFLKEIECFK